MSNILMEAKYLPIEFVKVFKNCELEFKIIDSKSMIDTDFIKNFRSMMTDSDRNELRKTLLSDGEIIGHKSISIIPINEVAGDIDYDRLIFISDIISDGSILRSVLIDLLLMSIRYYRDSDSYLIYNLGKFYTYKNGCYTIENDGCSFPYIINISTGIQKIKCQQREPPVRSCADIYRLDNDSAFFYYKSEEVLIYDILSDVLIYPMNGIISNNLLIIIHNLHKTKNLKLMTLRKFDVTHPIYQYSSKCDVISAKIPGLKLEKFHSQYIGKISDSLPLFKNYIELDGIIYGNITIGNPIDNKFVIFI